MALEKEKSILPAKIENLIGMITVPAKGYEDIKRPDGAKPDTNELVKMTQDQVRGCVMARLELGTSPEQLASLVKQLVRIQKNQKTE